MHRTTAEVPAVAATYALIHDAMVRDAERLVRTVEQPGGPSDPAALARWFARFEREITHHHEREDDIVFPALRERAPGFAADMEVLDRDHHELDDAMAATAAALTAGPAAAVDAASRFATLLEAHLQREEEATFWRLDEHFSHEEYAQVERRMLKATPLPLVAFEVPWALDHLPADAREAQLAEIPAPLRLLYRAVFVPRYRRLDAALVA